MIAPTEYGVDYNYAHRGAACCSRLLFREDNIFPYKCKCSIFVGEAISLTFVSRVVEAPTPTEYGVAVHSAFCTLHSAFNSHPQSFSQLTERRGVTDNDELHICGQLFIRIYIDLYLSVLADSDDIYCVFFAKI